MEDFKCGVLEGFDVAKPGVRNKINNACFQKSILQVSTLRSLNNPYSVHQCTMFYLSSMLGALLLGATSVISAPTANSDCKLLLSNTNSIMAHETSS
jgi:hypothetical protein